MFKIKTLIAISFSILMGAIAVWIFTHINKDPLPQKPAVRVEKKLKPEKKHEPISFSQAIPSGMRITTIKVNEVSGVTRKLKKGDRVDVLAITSLRGGTGGMISRIVLQNISIFGLEDNMQKKQLIDKAAKRKKEWNIHLMVTPNQGAVLSSISTGAKLRFLLRNNSDNEILETSPTVYTSGTGIVSIDYSATDPTSLIRPGMRAVTLKIDNTDGICGSLSPGDMVDIIFSCKASRFSTKGGNQAVGTKGEIFDVNKSSRILIQNVEVLTTQQALKSLLETNTPAKFITLSVTPSQAEKLTVITDSSKSGKLKLIARNLMDRKKVPTSGTFLRDLLLKDKKAYRIISIMRGSNTQQKKFYVN